jgi:hypothetical protein
LFADVTANAVTATAMIARTVTVMIAVFFIVISPFVNSIIFVCELLSALFTY